MTIQVDDIVAHASNSVFGNKLMLNVFRATVVEAIVDKALPDSWLWCSSDWSSHDFLHQDKTRLEVKQSAALQSWKTAKPSEPIFDIAPRKGYWKDGVEWVEKFGRHTDIYLFAHHPIFDVALADHRNPYQWKFYMLAASQIDSPTQGKISLNKIRDLRASASDFEGLAEAIESTREWINGLKELT